MARKMNRKKSTKSESRPKGTAIALTCALALSAFGLWRCLSEDESGPSSAPKLRAAAVKAIDTGPGNEVDPTILEEEKILKQERAPQEEPPEAPAPGDAKQAASDVSIAAAGTAQAVGESREDALAEKKYPLYAVAFHFHAQIFAEPKASARVTGYLRRGAKLRVGERLSTAGCKKGWHEIAGGGFLCDGDGVQVAREEVTFAPSPPDPNLGSPLPYDYKYVVADDIPEYWKIPTQEEISETAKTFARLSKGAQNEDQKDEEALRAILAKASAIGRETDGGPDEGAQNARAKTPLPTPTTEADAGDDDELPAYVHLRMTKGYYVSTDDTVTENGVTYARTVRGRFIPADKLAPAKGSSFEGALVTERTPLPLAFVVAGGTKVLGRKGKDGPLKELEATSRYDRFAVLEELTYKGTRYVRIGENRYLPARAVDVARKVAPPALLAPEERWIDVNLQEQTLVAYEGETPVFATLVSTGREGHETPTGAFRIYGKHVTITMDDTLAGDEAYSIEDVPWTQYFQEGYALHAAFWHDRFGRVRSHGCVNLSPSDARRLFFWTGPRLSKGLHGTVATASNLGTRVIIHR